MLDWLKNKLGITKSAPSGLGPYSLGDTIGTPWVDAYRKIRQPTRPELVAQYRNAVYTCANLNANAVAQVPLKLYVQTGRKDAAPKCYTKALDPDTLARVKTASAMTGSVRGDSAVEEVPDHPLLDLLTKPNPYMGYTDLIRLTSLYLDIVGSAFWYVGDRDGLGIPSEIWPIPAHQCYPWRDDMTSDTLISAFLFTSGRKQWKIPPADIVHFKLANLYEPYSMGFSPLHALWEPVGVTERHYGHMQNLLDNQARPDALVTPGMVIGEHERSRLEVRLNNKFRGGGTGGMLVTEDDMKVQPIGWSPVDLGIFQTLGITQDMIANAYGVPLSMLTKDTNLANLQASLTQHARFGVLPRVRARDEVVNRYLIPLYDDSGRLFVCSDNPVPDDEAAIAAKVTAMVGSGVWTPNEGRAATGKQPEPWGETPRMPGTMKPIDAITGKPDEPAPAGPGVAVHVGGANAGGKPSGEKKGKSKGKKKNGNPKGKGLSAEAVALYGAVRKGNLPPALAVSLLEASRGVAASIPFEEAVRGLAVVKDISGRAAKAQWAMDRLAALPGFGDKDEVPVPFPVAIDPYPEAQNVLSKGDWKDQSEGVFVIRELTATQPTVFRAKVREYLLVADDDDEKRPRIVIVGSKLYIDGGHHHLTAMWLLGRSEVCALFYQLPTNGGAA